MFDWAIPPHLHYTVPGAWRERRTEMSSFPAAALTRETRVNAAARGPNSQHQRVPLQLEIDSRQSQERRNCLFTWVVGRKSENTEKNEPATSQMILWPVKQVDRQEVGIWPAESRRPTPWCFPLRCTSTPPSGWRTECKIFCFLHETVEHVSDSKCSSKMSLYRQLQCAGTNVWSRIITHTHTHCSSTSLQLR